MATQSLSQLATRLRERMRRSALRAVSMAAVTGMLIAAVPREAAAQGVTGNFSGVVGPQATTNWAPPPPPPPWLMAPYTLSFTRLECLDESGEWGSDEPYVFIFVGDLKNPLASQVYRTSIFSGVDSGESRSQTVGLWQSIPMPLGNPDNLIVLVQVMEHDYSPVSTIHAGLRQSLPWAFDSYVRSGASRDSIVSSLKWKMYDEIDNQDPSWVVKYPLSGDSLDDYVGTTQELRITTTDMQTAYLVTPAQKMVDANGGGTRYRSYFELRRG